MSLAISRKLIKKSWRLKVVLVCWFLAISIIPLFASVSIVVYFMNKNVYREFHEKLEDSSRGVLYEFNEIKTSLVEVTKRQHKEWFLVKALRSRNLFELQKQMQNFKAFSPEYELSVYDLKHELVGSSLVKLGSDTSKATEPSQKNEPESQTTGAFQIDLSDWEDVSEKSDEKEIAIDISGFEEIDPDKFKSQKKTLELPAEHTSESSVPTNVVDELESQDHTIKISSIPNKGFKISVYMPIIDTVYNKTWGILKASRYVDKQFILNLNKKLSVNVSLFDSQGVALSSTFKSSTNIEPTTLKEIDKLDKTIKITNHKINKERFSVLFQPVIDNHKKNLSGIIAVSSSEQFFREALSKIQYTMSTMGLIAVILVVLTSLMISNRISNPLSKLSKLTKKISSGKEVDSRQLHYESFLEVNDLSDAFFKMSGDLKISRDSLVSEKDYVSNIIKSMIDSLLVVSPDGVIQRTNEAATKLLGYSNDEIVGKNVNQIFSQKSENAEEELQNLLNSEIVKDYDIQYKSKSGDLLPMSLSASSIKGAKTKTSGTVCVAKDMREYIRLAKKAEQAIEEAAKAENARLDAELKTAKIVQETLLPQKLPDIDAIKMSGFYQPASECGGDWWGYHILGDELVVMIADVTGHGAGAALITAAVQSTVLTLMKMYEQEPSSFDAAQFLEKLNESLFGTTRGGSFLTFFCATINVKTGVLKFSNAGHNFPWIYRTSKQEGDTASKDNIETLMLRGQHLGKYDQVSFEVKQTKLYKNDKFLLFTDGLPEQVNPDDKEYGNMKFLRSFLKHVNLDVVQLNTNLVSDLTEFKKDAEILDDWTLVSVEFKG